MMRMRRLLLSLLATATAYVVQAQSTPIPFEDAEVKNICVENWDTNGDGELSYDEAAAVTDLGKVFRMKSITAFNELQYFTGLTSIGMDAFHTDRYLRSVVLPNGVKSIEESAFFECYVLDVPEFPSSLESIGNQAFIDCRNFKSVVIPAWVTHIESSAFGGCTGLTELRVDEGNVIYESPGNCNAIIEKASKTLVCGCKTTVIPEGIIDISYGSFRGCTFTQINLPSSLKRILGGAFMDCKNLESIDLPEGLTTIWWHAFEGCSSLSSLHIPSTVTTIGSGITTTRSDKLVSLTVANGNSYYDSREGCNAIIHTATNELIAGCETTVIPSSVTRIGYGAMESRKGLTSVVLPPQIESLGEWAYAGCDKLESFTFNKNLKKTDGYVLSNSPKLRKVIALMPHPISMGKEPFRYLSKEATLYVPYGTKSLYEQAEGWDYFENIVEMEKVDEPETIERVEYFFDTDPGHGQGHIINNVEEGENAVQLSTEGLRPGAHLLFMRSQGSDGVWSATQAHAFYLSSKKSEQVTRLEYFFDTDPGYGQGKPISDVLNSNGTTALDLSTEDLLPGNHLLFVRALGNQGQWSSVMAKPFYLQSNTATNVRRLEYFFDTDPGYGKGTLISTIHEGDQQLILSTEGLLPGTHLLFLRSQTDDGVWSSTQAHPFYLSSKKAAQPARIEYFIDNDPGYGKGQSIVMQTDSASLSLSLDNVGYGAHLLCVRTQDEQGHWSTVQAHPFLVCDRSGFIAMEYYIDNDPGKGKATIIDMPPMFRDSNPEFAFSVPTDELANGEHTIYVRGMDAKGNWSEVSQKNFKVLVNEVPAPTIAYKDGIVTMSCEDSEATIGYTLDGTNPTKENCTVYTSPISVDRNLTVKAFAYKGTKQPSSVVNLQIDDFVVAPVTITFANNTITLSTSTTGATIHYTLDGTDPTTSSPIYTGPISITDDCIVKAFATKDGYHNSPISQQAIMIERDPCPDVACSYNGRYVTLSCEENGATIRYTLDGTEPVTASPIVVGSIDVGGLVTVKAVATKEGMNPSSVMTFTVPCYFDGTTAQVATTGTLTQAFGWCDAQKIETLTIIGNLDETDLSTVRSLSALRHANLKQVAMAGGTLPDYAFTGMNLISIELPTNIQATGKQLFTNCKQLATIGWNANAALNATVLSGIDNPNLLLYAESEALVAQSGIANVVAGGVAKVIRISDVTGNGNFYSMREFTAQNISYTHFYGMQSGYGECQGWETLTLPFDVQTISHEERGMMTPFANSTGSYDEHPFWLCELTTTGWKEIPQLKANTPYLISMPNNEAYSEQYILAGNVTFASSQVQVPVTETHVASNSNSSFVPTTLAIEASEIVYALNLLPYGEYAEGSVFVAGLRQVRPFEAYRTTTLAGTRCIPISSDMLTGISRIKMKVDNANDIYDLQGRKVRNKGQSTGNLRPGIYIQNGKKLNVKK